MDSTEDAGAAAELTRLVLDELGPALRWYHAEVARRVGLDPVELQCLHLLERHGVAASGLVGDRTGLSRSAVAKLLHRLERDGHVERSVRRGRAQEVEVVLRPHVERDATLDVLRSRVDEAMAGIVANLGLCGLERRSAAAAWAAATAVAIHLECRLLADAVTDARIRAARRRARVRAQ